MLNNEDFDDAQDGKLLEPFLKPRPCDIVWRDAKGKRPEGVLVHKNGNESDDRIENLELIPWRICAVRSTIATTEKEESENEKETENGKKKILSSETRRYLNKIKHKIKQFSELEQQEEYALAKRWCEHADRAARDRLITSHLPLVVKIAKKHCYKLLIEDLVSEGTIGLIEAVDHFDLEEGVRLATCATEWIKGAIRGYARRFRSLLTIGTTDNQKKLFFNLPKEKRRIGVFHDNDMRPDQVKLIAKRLGVTEQEVIEMNRRRNGDVSLNEPTYDEDGNENGELIDQLADGDYQPQQNGGAWWFSCDNQESQLAESEQSNNRHEVLVQALNVLDDPRERRIFEARRLADEPITLEELADEFGISHVRVCQIEELALNKIRRRVAALENLKAARGQYAVGDKVHVTDGPFATFSGVVEEVDEARLRLKVALSAWNSAGTVVIRQIELDFSQVAKCNNGIERQEAWTTDLIAQTKRKEKSA